MSDVSPSEELRSNGWGQHLTAPAAAGVISAAALVDLPWVVVAVARQARDQIWSDDKSKATLPAPVMAAATELIRRHGKRPLAEGMITGVELAEVVAPLRELSVPLAAAVVSVGSKAELYALARNATAPYEVLSPLLRRRDPILRTLLALHPRSPLRRLIRQLRYGVDLDADSSAAPLGGMLLQRPAAELEKVFALTVAGELHASALPLIAQVAAQQERWDVFASAVDQHYQVAYPWPGSMPQRLGPYTDIGFALAVASPPRSRYDTAELCEKIRAWAASGPRMGPVRDALDRIEDPDLLLALIAVSERWLSPNHDAAKVLERLGPERVEALMCWSENGSFDLPRLAFDVVPSRPHLSEETVTVFLTGLDEVARARVVDHWLTEAFTGSHQPLGYLAAAFTGFGAQLFTAVPDARDRLWLILDRVLGEEPYRWPIGSVAALVTALAGTFGLDELRNLRPAVALGRVMTNASDERLATWFAEQLPGTDQQWLFENLTSFAGTVGELFDIAVALNQRHPLHS